MSIGLGPATGNGSPETPWTCISRPRPTDGLADPRNYDFSITPPGAAAIDRGVEFEYRPKYEYVHPTHARPRQQVWRIDVGALERCGI